MQGSEECKLNIRSTLVPMGGIYDNLWDPDAREEDEYKRFVQHHFWNENDVNKSVEV